MDGVCVQATCRRLNIMCHEGQECNCIGGTVGELCLLTVVVSLVVIVVLVLSIAYCVQKYEKKKKKKKKKTTSAALVSASSELKDDDTVEHAIEVNDGPAEEEKLFQPSARALARGLISVVLLAIVLSDTVKMSEVTTTYYSPTFSKMSTIFSADLSTLKVEVEGSIPGFPSFPIAEDSMTWEEYCVAVEKFENLTQTFREVGLIIPGPVQCSYVAPARSFIIAAVAMYSMASVSALHPLGNTFGMVTSMLGWVFVVAGVCFWFAVIGGWAEAWTSIKAGVGILLSISTLGVTIIAFVLPKRP
ncbi:Hypothetical Protein FCC1311_051802 [Hondaea fermentalgiana]|uniref:Uncharacterized protein n=1 Tax=Hondaea fermentalgiana TaxID=2315210 RepID=A0A2R5GF56_9STRA|nr:Hypothetical Protein FCC1311_051802 [Hondaea fermentalgiana]|eukprot:GBG28959.1 Hypothetical Protein FCC1311_051802 [Hondaea fermentalgiana]